MTSRSWPLQRALFGVNLFVALGGLGLFACLSYLLVSRVFQSAFIEHFRVNERLFIDSVTNDVLTGLDFEAYRKCKLFHQSGGIHSIRITASSGRNICFISDEPRRGRASDFINLESTVFFDERRTSPAATVSISFKDDTKRELIRNFILVLSFTTLCLALILGALVRVMSLAIAIPIRRLSDLLENADLERMAAESGPDEASPIHEVRVLYRTTARMARRVMSMQGELIQRSKEEALANMASQVAHDIRSPLAALEVAAGDLSQVPEDKRVLIRSAANRIHDIASGLLEGRTRQGAQDATSPQFLWSLLDSIVSEKRLQLRSKPGVELALSQHDYGCFAAVQPVEFKRLISNLINNSVEALRDDRGRVRVEVGRSGSDIRLLVLDDGVGIPADILTRLGRRGETHGKSGGTGLGLHHARTNVESWGGRLDIMSENGKGTTVTLTLPGAADPAWFVPEIRVRLGGYVVILDDDQSIHRIWRSRLDSLNASSNGVVAIHATVPDELRGWIRNNRDEARGALFLLDYELAGHPESGLDLAAELAIGGQVILVTSRHEEAAVIAQCLSLGARLLPKGLAGTAPLIVDASIPTTRRGDAVDAVLIDDDALTRATWQVSASRRNKRLLVFPTLEEFLCAADSIERRAPVYVDVELADGVKGTEASRRIHELGFAEIYLTTGHAAETFSGLPYLRAIIGKTPPWA